jgi:hypothetical protein
MMEYFIAKEASQDLDEILDYFLVRNVNAGEGLSLDKCGQPSSKIVVEICGSPIQHWIHLSWVGAGERFIREFNKKCQNIA